MSIDEEIAQSCSTSSLISVLEDRKSHLNDEEIWALLKETCIALGTLEVFGESPWLGLDCLVIDNLGNIKVNLEQLDRNSCEDRKADGKPLINSLGEMFKYILINYSNVNENEDIFQLVDQMVQAKFDDGFTVHNIELYADRQLNGSSMKTPFNPSIASKKSEELSSAFQDSFLSTEYSSNTNEDSDSDQSICITKDFDTLSVMSDGKSFDNSEESKYFVCVNQLWSYCLDPIFKSDQEYLIFIYVILKEMSNVLLNEENFKKCLCISKENVFLNPLGQMLLNFPLVHCDRCIKESGSIKYQDSKYINIVGQMLFDIKLSDHRVHVSNQVSLLLQRMTMSTDMIISEILDFCKTNSSFKTVNCRSVLKRLFTRWNHWFTIHLRYLLKLKHKFLYEISSKNLKDNLKPTFTKQPIGIFEWFQRHPSWINGLKYVTKLASNHTIPLKVTYKEAGTNSLASAFRRYNVNANALAPKLNNITRIKTSTHFRPLVLSSESNSVHKSHENMFSPIDVSPRMSNIINSTETLPSMTTLSSSKIWRSMNHLPLNVVKHEGEAKPTTLSSLRRSTNSKCDIKPNHQIPLANRSSKVNLVIDVIEAVLSKSFTADNDEIGNRHLLGVADFALSLGRLSKSVFSEEMKTRFIHIRWSKESLSELYDIISSKDTSTPQSENRSSDLSYKDFDNRKELRPLVINKDSEDRGSNCNETNVNLSKSSVTSSAPSVNSESFEDIERQCQSVVIHEKAPPSSSAGSHRNPESSHSREPLKNKSTSDLEGSSDISDYLKIKTTPVLPNKLQHKFSIHTAEDALFFEQVSPVTLLCFPSTAAYVNQSSNGITDQVVSANKIQELRLSFQDINKTIRCKFKELSKTLTLISKCSNGVKNVKKDKKRFIENHKELQLDIESLIISEMKLEQTIVEYHSVSLETILDEIKSNNFKQSIIFCNDIRNFQNLQFIHPFSLVTCLFARGAVSSGLLYDFFLVYREFFQPQEFIENLKAVFKNLEQKLQSGSLLLMKARFRLLYIILCWIDGFYMIDINPPMISLIRDLAKIQLMPYITNVIHIIEHCITHSRSSKSALGIQFTALKTNVDQSIDIIHNVDIEKIAYEIEKKEKDKGKLQMRLSINMTRSNSLGNQDTFSIFNISAKDLAISLTLIQQACFNSIHPCHLLLYLRSISDSDDSILNSINNDRFPARTLLPSDTFHKEIRTFLLLSGQITHWAISEILLTTDLKLQAKIVKKLVITCNWCKELNNYATMSSIEEALTSDKLKWAPFWSNISTKVTKSLKEVTCILGKLFNSTDNWPDGHETSSNALLSGFAFLPCIHAILVHLKMSSFGNCLTRDGCLKWMKLKKLCKILDQIRLYKQFRYSSNDSAFNDLRSKIKFRIEHLTSISLDILQSHNMLAQTS